MKELKNAVGISFVAMWTIALGILMFRLPIATVLGNSQMFQEISVDMIDIILSVAFCIIGILSAVAGYLLRNRTLLYLSMIHLGLAVLSVVTLLLYFVTLNGDIFAVFLYLVNPFVSVLVADGSVFYVYTLPVFVITLALIPTMLILSSVKEKKNKNNRKTYRAEITHDTNKQGGE